MSYEDHNEHMCDRCARVVGRNNLRKMPFIYMDKNDKAHPDMSRSGMEPGYRQYWVCDDCWKMEERIRENKENEKMAQLCRGFL